MKKLLVAAALMLGLLSGADAQTAIVVQTCGTLPQQYSVGASRQVVQDINGNFCTNASGGGGGGAVTIVDGGDVTQGAKADAACGTDTGTCTVVALVKRLLQSITTALSSLATIATNTSASVPAGTATIGTVGQLPYPVGATPIVASATGTTGATTATLTGAASVTTYICSYSVRANATAAATVNNTIAPIASGITMTHVMWVAPLASGLGIDEQIFMPCLPASAVNTSIAVISGAPGSGGAVTVTAAGYRL